MPLIFREIGNKSWWDKAHDEFCWLGDEELVGDVFKGVKTIKGTLSTYRIEDEQSSLQRVVAALACKRSSLENFDFVVVPENEMETSFDFLRTPGNTADELVNGLHRDIVRLTAADLMTLVLIFRDHMGAMTRLYRDDVKAAILESLSQESLREDDVNGGVKKHLF